MLHAGQYTVYTAVCSYYGFILSTSHVTSRPPPRLHGHHTLQRTHTPATRACAALFRARAAAGAGCAHDERGSTIHRLEWLRRRGEVRCKGEQREHVNHVRRHRALHLYPRGLRLAHENRNLVRQHLSIRCQNVGKVRVTGRAEGRGRGRGRGKGKGSGGGKGSSVGEVRARYAATTSPRESTQARTSQPPDSMHNGGSPRRSACLNGTP